ncbi:MAG: Ig-like domain-containing protein [Solirubrobacteraceae bacterium]
MPADAAHTLDAGPAGWTETAQVTATGCGTGSCPVAVGAWNGASSTGGVLRNALSGTAGHAGQATVTWRSPVFAVPAASTAASFSLSMASDYTWTPSAGAVPTYTVHLLDSGTGTVRTVVDSNPVPTPDQGWASSGAVPLPAGTLVPGSVERLEIVVRFPIGSRSGDAVVSLDDPTLSVDQRTSPLPSSPGDMGTSPLTGLPPVTTVPPTATPVPAPSDEDPADPDPEDDAASCEDGDVAVVGASAIGRTLAISGTADADAGARVDLLSAEGFVLGRTTVDAHGRFSARVAEPKASSGTRKVVARLADGRRSEAETVVRQNVLRTVRPTSRGFVVDGTLDPKVARRGHLAIDLETTPGDACATTAVVHATSVRVDRRTGGYHAVVPTAALRASATSSLSAPQLVRARVTQNAPGRARLVTRSQVIFASESDRRGT